MNRRQFLQTASLATGALFLPFSIVAATPKPKISWKDFDWMPFPSCLAFRVEAKNGKHFLTSIPYVCKTWKTKIFSFVGEPDLTREKCQIPFRYIVPNTIASMSKIVMETREVHVNETLLLEAQKMGITHLYMFVRNEFQLWHPTENRFFNCYYVRGARLPDWKTNRGKLQVVNV